MIQQQIEKLLKYEREGYLLSTEGEEFSIIEDEDGNYVYTTWSMDGWTLMTELEEGLVEVLKPVEKWWV